MSCRVTTDLSLMLELWTELVIVHGKPRHPQSQGFVEQANSDIKDMLIAWMSVNDTRDWSVGNTFVQFRNNSRLNNCRPTPRLTNCRSTPKLTNCRSTLSLTNCRSTPKLTNCRSTPRLTNCRSTPRLTNCRSTTILTSCRSTPRMTSCKE